VTRFPIDNQLPAALAHWLHAQGHDAEHVLTLDLGQKADALIWEHAARTGPPSRKLRFRKPAGR